MLGSNLQVQELLHVIDSKVAFFNNELRTDATLCYIYIYIYLYNELCKTRVLIGLEECVIRV